MNDEFRWLDEMGYEDAEFFLAEINDAFTTFPTGLSLGDGKRPFRRVDAESLEEIATVGDRPGNPATPALWSNRSLLHSRV